MCLGGGCLGRVHRGGGGGLAFLWKMKEKGEGVGRIGGGVGVGTFKGTASQCASFVETTL